MKVFAKSVVLFLGVLLACEKQEVGTIWIPVFIYELNVPETGLTNQNIAIEVWAQTTNGCQHGIEFMMVETGNHYVRITARALVPAKATACPAVIGYKDSLMVFKPTMTGKYFFQANEAPLELKLDTLVVN